MLCSIRDKIWFSLSEADLRGARGTRPPYFLQSLVFCNYFKELEIVLFRVQLIINNAPLTYVYPNTIETCLKPNLLLFGRQLLYSSNTTINCSYEFNRSLKHY